MPKCFAKLFHQQVEAIATERCYTAGSSCSFENEQKLCRWEQEVTDACFVAVNVQIEHRLAYGAYAM